MNQENIFKLLLIVLIISNNSSGGECNGKTIWGNLNDVILIALLLGLLDNGTSETAVDTSVTTFT